MSSYKNPSILYNLAHFSHLSAVKATLPALLSASRGSADRVSQGLRRSLLLAAGTGDATLLKKTLARGGVIEDPQVAFAASEIILAACRAERGSIKTLLAIEALGYDLLAPLKTSAGPALPIKEALLSGNFVAGSFLAQRHAQRSLAGDAELGALPLREIALCAATGAGERAALLQSSELDALKWIALDQEALSFFKTLALPEGALKPASQSEAFMALASPHDLSLKILSHLGADLDQPAPISGRTALHRACDYANSQSVETLLALGAQVGLLDAHGQTPLSLISERAALLAQHNDRSLMDSMSPSEGIEPIKAIISALLRAGANPSDARAIDKTADRVYLGLQPPLARAPLRADRPTQASRAPSARF